MLWYCSSQILFSEVVSYLLQFQTLIFYFIFSALPDIRIDNIPGDKTIYNVLSSGQYFYLSTGLGVIVIDADKYEVKDSWFIGNSGGQVKVNGFVAANSFFYAASDEGLKRTAINTVDPANYLNWQTLAYDQVYAILIGAEPSYEDTLEFLGELRTLLPKLPIILI